MLLSDLGEGLPDKGRLVAFEFQINNGYFFFLVSHDTYLKKSIHVYLKFKFNHMPCVFIC
jgi:hypothetical protein